MSGKPQYAKERDRALEIAPSNFREALRIAHGIDDSWFQCQALSFAGKYCPDKQLRSEILSEAFDVAEKLREPNRVVTVSAWPLAAYVKWNEIEELEYSLDLLLTRIAKEPSPVRRADALEHVLKALIGSTDAIFLKVFALFSASCLTPLRNGKRNRRGQSALAEWLGHVWQMDTNLANIMLSKIEGPKHRERALFNIKEVQGR